MRVGEEERVWVSKKDDEGDEGRAVKRENLFTTGP